MRENLVIYLSAFNVGTEQLYHAILSHCFREDKGTSRNKKIILSREPYILSLLSTLPLAACVIPGTFFNLESPFLALVKLPQHQKEKIFLHSHPCQMLPRKGRGHNLSVLKCKLSRRTCLGNPVEVALPGDVNVYYRAANSGCSPPWLGLIWSSEARFALRHGRDLSYPP